MEVSGLPFAASSASPNLGTSRKRVRWIDWRLKLWRANPVGMCLNGSMALKLFAAVIICGPSTRVSSVRDWRGGQSAKPKDQEKNNRLFWNFRPQDVNGRANGGVGQGKRSSLLPSVFVIYSLYTFTLYTVIYCFLCLFFLPSRKVCKDTELLAKLACPLSRRCYQASLILG